MITEPTITYRHDLNEATLTWEDLVVIVFTDGRQDHVGQFSTNKMFSRSDVEFRVNQIWPIAMANEDQK